MSLGSTCIKGRTIKRLESLWFSESILSYRSVIDIPNWMGLHGVSLSISASTGQREECRRDDNTTLVSLCGACIEIRLEGLWSSCHCKGVQSAVGKESLG